MQVQNELAWKFIWECWAASCTLTASMQTSETEHHHNVWPWFIHLQRENDLFDINKSHNTVIGWQLILGISLCTNSLQSSCVCIFLEYFESTEHPICTLCSENCSAYLLYLQKLIPSFLSVANINHLCSLTLLSHNSSLHQEGWRPWVFFHLGPRRGTAQMKQDTLFQKVKERAVLGWIPVEETRLYVGPTVTSLVQT